MGYFTQVEGWERAVKGFGPSLARQLPEASPNAVDLSRSPQREVDLDV